MNENNKKPQNEHITITAFALCDKGLEDACQFEISQKAKSESITSVNRGCIFQTSAQQLAQFTYQTQSALRTLILLAQEKHELQNSSDEKEQNTQLLLKSITKTLENYTAEDTPQTINFWLRNVTFKVDTINTQNIDSQEIAKQIGGFINEKTQATADMRSPIMKFLIIITEDAWYAGIDMAQQNLAKREYKIFTSPTTIRSTIGYGLLHIAEFTENTENKTILDPFTGSGTIPIEAAFLATNKSPRFYEKEKLAFTKFPQLQITLQDNTRESTAQIHGFDIQSKAVDMSKKNAKIADVVSDIRLARCDVDWIDTKFADESIDIIIGAPPYFSNHNPDTKILKPIEQLFDRGIPLLKKNGIIVLLTNNAEKIVPIIPKSMKLVESRQIFMGKEELWFVKMQKN